MATREHFIATAVNHYVADGYLFTDFICPCCDMVKLVPAFYRHVGLLELMRRELGFPIEVTSGYRCPAHNRTVGGSPKSWHMLFATDIRPQDLDPEKLTTIYQWALDERFGGIGLYDGHIHLDLRPERVLWRG